MTKARTFPIGHGIIKAGVGRVPKHRGTDYLVFKILIYISDLSGKDAHIGGLGIQSAGCYASLKVPAYKLGDEAVEHFAEGGFAAAVVADDGKEIALLYADGYVFKHRLLGARIAEGQIFCLYDVHFTHSL